MFCSQAGWGWGWGWGGFHFTWQVWCSWQCQRTFKMPAWRSVQPDGGGSGLLFICGKTNYKNGILLPDRFIPFAHHQKGKKKKANFSGTKKVFDCRDLFLLQAGRRAICFVGDLYYNIQNIFFSFGREKNNVPGRPDLYGITENTNVLYFRQGGELSTCQAWSSCQ